MYREKLHASATKAMKTHGTKAVIDMHSEPTSPPPGDKEVDFFKEHENMPASAANNTGKADPIPVSNGTSLSKPAVPGQSNTGVY